MDFLFVFLFVFLKQKWNENTIISTIPNPTGYVTMSISCPSGEIPLFIAPMWKKKGNEYNLWDHFNRDLLPGTNGLDKIACISHKNLLSINCSVYNYIIFCCVVFFFYKNVFHLFCNTHLWSYSSVFVLVISWKLWFPSVTSFTMNFQSGILKNLI